MTFIKRITDNAVRELSTLFPDSQAGAAFNTYRPGHSDAGRAGAGAILYSVDLGNYCLFQRAHGVSEPATWSTVGGIIEPGETAQETTIREMREEIGYTGPVHLVPLFVYRDNNFTYTTFIGVVPNEFVPVLNHEVIGYRWNMYGHYPNPLHPGFQVLLDDPAAVKKLAEVDFSPPDTSANTIDLPIHAVQSRFE